MNRRAFLLGSVATVATLATGGAASRPIFTYSAFVKESGSTEWTRRTASYYADFENGEYWIEGEKASSFQNFLDLTVLSQMMAAAWN